MDSEKQNPTPIAPLLTVDDVAAILNLHPVTVRKLQLRGEIPALHIGRSVRFAPAAIAALIAGDKPGVVR